MSVLDSLQNHGFFVTFLGCLEKGTLLYSLKNKNKVGVYPLSKGGTALLIIDVQEAMFSYPDEKLYDESGTMERIITLLDKARHAKVPIVYIQHTSDDEYTKGTHTWQINSRITPQASDFIIEKPTWDAFHLTTLNEVLQKLGVTNLIIAGMQTEFCVDTTCRRSFSMGYSSILVEDAHSTFDHPTISSKKIIQYHNRVLGGRFVTLKKESEVLF